MVLYTHKPIEINFIKIIKKIDIKKTYNYNLYKNNKNTYI